MDFIYTEN